MKGNEEHMQRLNLLGIDTSTAAMTAALLTAEGTLASIRSDAERNHSIKLVPAVDELLNEHSWTEATLDGIAVGIGPGSYTGVRIAVTAAKTMAWAWDKPIIGVSSVEALAWSGLAAAMDKHADVLTDAGEYLIHPMMDARRGQVYTARFCGQGAAAKSLQVWNGTELPADVCVLMQADGIRLFVDVAAELEEQLDAKPALHVWLVGETTQQQERLDALQAKYGERVHVVPCEMDAAWIAKLGSAGIVKGQADDVHRMEPNYTQLAEAEVKLNAKEQAAAKSKL